MLDLILKGIVTGFILSIMIGPVFFVLLETSIRKGIRAGLAFNFGVFISDVCYILIAYLFFAQVNELASGEGRHTARIIGGILFLTYGVFQFLKKPQHMDVEGINTRKETSWGDYSLLSLKGFLLNFANPLVIFYWFSVLTLGPSENSGNGHIFWYVIVILVTFFSIDILKIIGAKQLRPLVTNRLLKALNQLIGIVFVCFGIILLIQGIFHK